MKVLFLPHEEYTPYDKSAMFFEVISPIIETNFFEDYKFFVYQRVRRKLGNYRCINEAIKTIDDYKPDIIIYFFTWLHDNLDSVVLSHAKDINISVLTIKLDSHRVFKSLEAGPLSSSTHVGLLTSVSDFIRFQFLHKQVPSFPKPFFIMGNNVLKNKFTSTNIKKDIDVLFLGSIYGKRVEFINFLKNKFKNSNINFVVAGGYINSTINSDFGGDNFGASADWLEIDDYIDLIRRSKICLNLDKTDASHIPAIKGKIFEYLSCGSLCISDSNKELRYLIKEEYIEYFEEFEDCYRLIMENLKDDKYSLKAAKGQEWYLKTFDSTNFWNDVFNNIFYKKTFDHPNFLNIPYEIHEKRFFKNLNNNEFIDFDMQI